MPVRITAPDTQRVVAGSLHIEYLLICTLIPDPKNTRRHSARQIAKLVKIINALGWSTPIVIDENNRVLAGHARLAAAKKLGMDKVPCIRLSHLDAAQKKALAVADNAMTDTSSFDDTLLREVLIELGDLDFDLELTGLEMATIDFVIDGPAGDAVADAADNINLPDADQTPVTRSGDVWMMGDHKLLCGDALALGSYEALLGDERATMVISDPPFNVPINGHVSGLGRPRHREFTAASGEMTQQQFRDFLATFMRRVCAFSADASLHFIFMDWRSIGTLLEAGAGIYTELKNICVWNKTNAGMGSLYRSKHELVAVFKHGTAPHINHVALGKYGRHRSNVWDYAGANTFSKTRDADLAAHPTVKPVALVADAIRDCSNRGDLVLDPFMGSGTTILAAERSGRRAAGLEIDPLYVDTAVRRWQLATGKQATLVGDGRDFDTIAAERLAPGACGREAA